MYELTAFFFFRPLFTVELLVAEMLFARHLARRRMFALRAVLSVAACIGLSFALPVVSYDTLYGSLVFLVLFAASIAALAVMFRDSLRNVIFCGIAGFTVQHMASELFELLNVATGLNGGIVSDFYGSSAPGGSTSLSGADAFAFTVYYLIFLVSYTAAFTFLSGLVRKYDVLSMGGFSMIAVSLLTIVVDVVLGAVIIWSFPRDAERIGVVLLHVYNLLCCALVLFLLFEMPRRRAAERELSVIKTVRHLEREKYAESKENVELINLKVHDLKHFLHSKGGSLGDGEMRELEKLTEIYDSTYRTGCEALDVVLMQKSLVCRAKGIRLSVIADGSALSGLSDADVYSLFGNILDNAVEAAERLPEDTRQIGLNVRRAGNFTAVTAYNGYDGEIRFENGLPVTAKADKAYHGFGLRSIERTTEKYGGTMRIECDGGVFCIKLLIPQSRRE